MSSNRKLEVLSAKIRVLLLKMLEKRGYGHLGGSMSIVEILAVLYGKHLRYDASNPQDPNRDYVVLSKGHAGPALYSALVCQGFFDEEVLYTLNEGGTILPSHPDRLKTPGIDATTGSLGQGTSLAAGIATAIAMKQTNQKVYLIVGDGELNEGQCWESFQYLAHHRYSHCVVIIDENKRQLDGFTTDIINPFDIEAKMKAFGFATRKVKGNDVVAIDEALKQLSHIENQAVCLVLDSIKGQGVKEYEEMIENHSVKFDNESICELNHQTIEKLLRFIEEEESCGN